MCLLYMFMGTVVWCTYVSIVGSVLKLLISKMGQLLQIMHYSVLDICLVKELESASTAFSRLTHSVWTHDDCMSILWR